MFMKNSLAALHLISYKLLYDTSITNSCAFKVIIPFSSNDTDHIFLRRFSLNRRETQTLLHSTGISQQQLNPALEVNTAFPCVHLGRVCKYSGHVQIIPLAKKLEIISEILENYYYTRISKILFFYIILSRNVRKQNLVGFEFQLEFNQVNMGNVCLLYTSPSPRDRTRSRMPSSA